ncbi:MAG: cyclopropane fatty acyl phospholipid synthase [Candidatus Liptonbacteria bacterium]|nr:cyclopropane fatty acyl phospholipid synthase [Candidatus Liptonbacteria bacterium]
MSNQFSKKVIKALFSAAGITVDGPDPWDIKVLDERFYPRVLRHGSMGFGESYMDGWWECGAIDTLIEKITHSGLREKARKSVRVILLGLAALLVNEGRRSKAFVIGERHYDLGNDLFHAMLDPYMIYSCAYWNGGARTLAEAQEAKLDLICRKLFLKPGMEVLDIGCGWGGFAKYAAERYGAKVTGVTVSKEQAARAAECCRGLPVHIRLEDYRSVRGLFDRVVSVGMFEHVGYKNHRVFMKTARRVLKESGLFLLHTIGSNVSRTSTDPWIRKYIFPVGMIPSIAQIGKAAERLFVMDDWHNFGADYDATLMAWFRNFDARWPALKKKYGERFYRMWKYYLLASAGTFRARELQLWQIVFSKRGAPGGYRSER